MRPKITVATRVCGIHRATSEMWGTDRNGMPPLIREAMVTGTCHSPKIPGPSPNYVN